LLVDSVENMMMHGLTNPKQHILYILLARLRLHIDFFFSRYIKKFTPGLVSNSTILVPPGLTACLCDELQIKI
jgi:hypothetical protein